MSEAEEARALALEYFQQAYEKQMSAELDQAVELHQKSIEVCPTAEAHTFLGWTNRLRISDLVRPPFGGFWKRGFRIGASVGFSIRIPHSAFRNRFDLGAYLIRKGQFDEAIPWLQRAMKAKRYEARAYPHMNLRRVWEYKGKILDAMREYRKAKALVPQLRRGHQGIETA